MTKDELLAALSDLDAALEQRVDMWCVIIDERGVPTGQRVYQGSFSMPADWRPPPPPQLPPPVEVGERE